MPYFSRLRLWLGVSALLMVGVVAGFYLYARYRVQIAVHQLPAKLGANIQQNTQGFTYSQAAGGHTIFSISASNAVRYKQGGKAELHNVKIVSYGRNSDRLDEITGDEFEYDAQSGDVIAKGKVAIQLQAVETGTSQAGDGPKRVGSPLHLDTSGLVFNQKTGVAHTSDRLTFQLPQGTGSAVGATYDSKANTFDLHSDIHLLTTGPKPMNFHAASANYVQEQQQLTLADLHTESGIRRLDAQHVVLHLREDNTVQRADASGGVNAFIRGERSAHLQAANANFVFAGNNQIATGVLSGGVTWDTSGARASRGNAGKVLLVFGANNQIKAAQLRDNVDLVQTSPSENVDSASSNSSDKRDTEFHGEGLDLQVVGGSRLETATSLGAAQITLATAQAAGTVLTAGRFYAKFAESNRLASLTGATPVKVVSSTPGKPDRISESHDLVATFTSGKTQMLENFVQTGDVQIHDGTRTASADQASYTRSSDTLALTGNVHYQEATTGATLTSNTLALNRTTGETAANGDVKTTYAEQKASASGAMLSASQAVHVTGQQMIARSSTGVARYSGGARLWEGGDIVQAPEIDFDRSQRTLDAQAQGSHRVSTVFVQPDKNGKNVPVEVTADRLRYDDGQRKAVFEGSIVLRSADSTLRANRATITLHPQTQRSKPPTPAQKESPSQLQSIDSVGDIQLQQPGRRATGTRLIYTADEGKFVLTGTPSTPPSIFDAEHGQVTGVSLTFFNRDDRVLVDSSNSTSISQTRPQK